MTLLNNLEVLVTADEGYRAFEKAVVAAKTRIDMGFRVFDPRMHLLSCEAREFGSRWVDLLLAKLNEGVDITIALSDFDPVVRPELHRGSFKSLSILLGIAEMVTGHGRLRVTVEDHPARVGWAPRIALWPKVQSQVAQTCDWLNGLEDAARAEAIRFMPRFTQFTFEKDGKIHPKRREFPPMLPVTHHQKLAVIDDEVLYVGGLDLDARRMDTVHHALPAEKTWHDVHVILQDKKRALSAREHLESFSAECAGEVSIRSPEGLLRTLSVKRKRNSGSLSPHVCDTGIMDRHLELIEQAERLIYLESQFLRDPVIADALVARAKTAPDLGLIILLPAAPLEVAFEGAEGLDYKFGEYLQAKAIGRITEAFGSRAFIASPAHCRKSEAGDRATLCGAPMIFVHSKVSIFDDHAGLVTSANLNGRSMRWDTELGIEISDPDQVRMLRKRVMGAWLPKGADDCFCAAAPETVKKWRELAQQNASRAPADRSGFVLPHTASAAESFGTLLPGIPVEMV